MSLRDILYFGLMRIDGPFLFFLKGYESKYYLEEIFMMHPPLNYNLENTSICFDFYRAQHFHGLMPIPYIMNAIISEFWNGFCIDSVTGNLTWCWIFVLQYTWNLLLVKMSKNRCKCLFVICLESKNDFLCNIVCLHSCVVGLSAYLYQLVWTSKSIGL